MSYVCKSAREIILYADDPNFLIPNDKIDYLIICWNTASHELSTECRDSGLALNKDKTYFKHFLSKYHDLCLPVNGK